MSRRMIMTLGLFALLAFAAMGCGRAQHASVEAPQPARDVVLGVTAAPQLDVVIETAIGLLDGQPIRAAHVVVVACGPAVKNLVANGVSAPIVDRGLARGVQIEVCGISLDRAGIAAAQLIEGVHVTPNGLAEIVRLQALGYLGVML